MVEYEAIEGKELSFAVKDGNIVDQQTGSVWTVTGKVVEGEYKVVQQLEAVIFGAYIVFAWLGFGQKQEFTLTINGI